MSDPVLSIVIPVYNEEAILEELYRRLTAALEKMGESFEVILVDDGSRDRSLEIIRDLRRRDPRYKYLSFARNFGHQIAISAGINFAEGQAVIIMDADLQDPPEELHRFVAKWREGYDVVYAIRRKRKEGLLKRIAYSTFYRLLAMISEIQIPLDSGDFCLMDRRIVELLNRLPERNRFVRGIRSWLGFKQIGLEYERHARYVGTPKYSLRRLFKLAFDGMVSFSTMPLRLASFLGFIVSGLAVLGILFTLAQRIFHSLFASLGLEPVPGYATTVILVLFLGGVQLICLGIIGEYLGRIHEEVKQRPLYILQEANGFDRPQSPLPRSDREMTGPRPIFQPG